MLSTGLRRAVRSGVLAVVLTVLAVAPAAADPVEVTSANITPPAVLGSVRWTTTATADPGVWDPADTALTFQWLRDGTAIRGATAERYPITSPADLGTSLSVRVAPVDQPGQAVTSPPRAVQKIVVRNLTPPSMRGTARYGKTLTMVGGRWSHAGLTYRRQWFSAGRKVSGATGRTYRIRPADVGHTVRVEVTASKLGYTTLKKSSRPVAVKHVVDTRRTVTYSVRTRGKITQSVATFKKQAQETFDDPRGWRANGIRFKRVSSGGSFTLVLSQASKVPSYSSGCSSAWSCRVGRYVVINQNRWRSATPSWNKAHGSLRNYRNMVINHETGHWLGKGHASCSSKGALAPVMQQQSKSLKGCRFNPWPKKSERYSPRFGF